MTERPGGKFGNTPIPHTVKQNMIINGYNGVWALDHDDGYVDFGHYTLH